MAWIGLTLSQNADHLPTICNFLFLGLGLLALYVSVLSVTNRTEIEVDDQELRIWHGPLPSLSRHMAVPVRDINQLLVKRIRTGAICPQGVVFGHCTCWTGSATIAN